MTDPIEYNPTRSRAYAMRALTAYTRDAENGERPTEPEIIPVVWPETDTSATVLTVIGVFLLLGSLAFICGGLLRLWVG